MRFLKDSLRLLVNPRARYANRAQPDAALLTAMAELDSGRPRLRLRHFTHNGAFMLGLAISLGFLFFVLFGPLLVNHDPNITAQTTLPHYDSATKEMVTPPFSPSAEHWLGTDRWGNDMWSLIVHGMRVTLVISLYITAVRVILGTILGSLAGWHEGKLFDRFVMGAINLIASVPILISSMVLILALDIEKGMSVFLIALSVVGWTEVAQFVRGEMLVIRRLGYIESATAVGLNPRQILVRHALPNVLPQLLVITFLEMGTILILLAELGFLGIFIGGGSRFSMGELGAPNPIPLIDVPEWGALVAQGAPSLRSNPHLVLAPALAFFIAVIGVNTLSEGLRRVLERAPFSTAFLLKKRMVLGMVLFVLLTAWVMDYTGPRLSYQRTAAQFDGVLAQEHEHYLAGLDGRGVGQPGSLAAANYIEARFREYDVARGSALPLNTTYRHIITTTISRPTTPPVLALVDEAGMVVRPFEHQNEFGYLLGDGAGEGTATAAVLFVGGMGETAVYDDLIVQDKIVLVGEAMPATFVTEMARRGARGIVQLTTAVAVRSQLQVDPPLAEMTVPVFRGATAVTEAILQANNLTWAQLNDPAGATQQGAGWFARALPTALHLSLTLDAPQVIEIPHMVGFLPGYDVDVVHELVVVVAHYDGWGVDSAGNLVVADDNGAGTAVLLEIARLFDAQHIDPRRSVLLVFWGGGTLDDPALVPYLEDRDNFRRLSAKVPSLLHKAEYVIQLDLSGHAGDQIGLAAGSDPALAALFSGAFAEFDVPMTTLPSAMLPMGVNDGGETAVPTLYLQWVDTSADAPPLTLAQVGQGVTRGLIELVREKWAFRRSGD